MTLPASPPPWVLADKEALFIRVIERPLILTLPPSPIPDDSTALETELLSTETLSLAVIVTSPASPCPAVLARIFPLLLI